MEPKKVYQNYLFDLYGTLADICTDEQSPEFWQSFQQHLEKLGAVWTWQALKASYEAQVTDMEAAARAELQGRGEPEIDLAPVFRSFLTGKGPETDEAAVAELAGTFRLLSIRWLKLYDGVTEMLKALHAHGKKVYLLSNAQALFTRPELEKLGLPEYFDGMLLSSEVGRKKPDTAFFRALLERYQLDPAVTVMVGNDDRADCEGAESAGLDSLYVRTRFSPVPKDPLPPHCRQIASISHVTDTL